MINDKYKKERDTGSIYGLLDQDGRIKYIGITTTSVKLRVFRHWNLRNKPDRKDSKKCRWLRTLKKSPMFVILAEKVPIDQLPALEKQAINYYSKRFDLVNGNGTYNTKQGKHNRDRLLICRIYASKFHPNKRHHLGIFSGNLGR